ncbi:MAG TPA: Uma2 family endonuclease [Gemmataceae bacterium]|nr:Uma2 family endonuclease [Gemmataceae bacterium]
MRTKRTRPIVGPHTWEDFCAIVSEDQKADLIDGVIYMASPENTDANEMFVWLITLMELFVEEYQLGKIYGSRVAARLTKKTAPEPDIVFVSKKNLHRVKRGGIEGAPDIAVEIVSPDSIQRDYDLKRKKYEEAGVPEYWIIDESEETVTLLRLSTDGKYREVKPKKGEFHSTVLKGFWLRPEWLFRIPRPRKLDALQMLLDRLK